ncbi:class I SAM-dependent methyltransferase [Pseudarthrobacter sp. DSP2-3-2b1]|uniref:class I SAM-dependent methyltransferase n=1 Tax=Pseudarthrobacter sp. DSP2-3-2b1 TaxID=2804661 RepID=UPI003CEF6D74
MSETRIAIDWETARTSNRENWKDRVPRHEKAYGIGDMDDPDHLTGVVRTDLAALVPFLPDGTVSGLDLCHLQCHIGTYTLSLARAGARVTGVDFSPGALACRRTAAPVSVLW